MVLLCHIRSVLFHSPVCMINSAYNNCNYRLTATTFGRSALLSPITSTPLPAAIDDEHLLEIGCGIQPHAYPSRLEFFLHSIELIDILYEILTRFYGQDETLRRSNNAVDRAGNLQAVLELASRIDRFEAGLPGFLRVDFERSSYTDKLVSCLQMQANILKSRYGMSLWWYSYLTS